MRIMVVYPTVRRPVTIGVRTTRVAGNSAATTPATSAAASARAIVRGAMLMMGKKVGSALPKPATMGNVSARPSRPPPAAMSSDSPKIRPTRWRAEKPSVFSTAYSRVRSRTAITIVFASTSRMIPTITTEITCIDVMMALDIATKLCWNAFSLSVLVGAREFRNCSSTAVPTRVDPPDHPLPATGEDVAFHRDRVAELESMLLRQLATDDAGVALLLERGELLGRHLELGVQIEERFRVHRQARPEILEVVGVAVHTAEPVGPRDRRDARDPGDLLAVRQRDREDERHAVPRDHPVRR